VRLVAGEGGVQPGKVAIGDHRLQLFPIEKIGGGAAFAEEKPVSPGVAKRPALVQETTKGRDARARANHDDGRRRFLRKAKLLVGLDIDGHALADGNLVGHIGGAHAAAFRSTARKRTTARVVCTSPGWATGLDEME